MRTTRNCTHASTATAAPAGSESIAMPVVCCRGRTAWRRWERGSCRTRRRTWPWTRRHNIAESTARSGASMAQADSLLPDGHHLPAARGRRWVAIARFPIQPTAVRSNEVDDMDYEPAESGSQHRQHGLVTRSWLSEGILHGMSCRTQAARRAGVIGGRRAPGSVAESCSSEKELPFAFLKSPFQNSWCWADPMRRNS